MSLACGPPLVIFFLLPTPSSSPRDLPQLPVVGPALLTRACTTIGCLLCSHRRAGEQQLPPHRRASEQPPPPSRSCANEQPSLHRSGPPLTPALDKPNSTSPTTTTLAARRGPCCHPHRVARRTLLPLLLRPRLPPGQRRSLGPPRALHPPSTIACALLDLAPHGLQHVR